MDHEREVIQTRRPVRRRGQRPQLPLGPPRDATVALELRGPVALDEIGAERRTVLRVEHVERRVALERLVLIDDRRIQHLRGDERPGRMRVEHADRIGRPEVGLGEVGPAAGRIGDRR